MHFKEKYQLPFLIISKRVTDVQNVSKVTISLRKSNIPRTCILILISRKRKNDYRLCRLLATNRFPFSEIGLASSKLVVHYKRKWSQRETTLSWLCWNCSFHNGGGGKFLSFALITERVQLLLVLKKFGNQPTSFILFLWKIYLFSSWHVNSNILFQPWKKYHSFKTFPIWETCILCILT